MVRELKVVLDAGIDMWAIVATIGLTSSTEMSTVDANHHDGVDAPVSKRRTRSVAHRNS